MPKEKNSIANWLPFVSVLSLAPVLLTAAIIALASGSLAAAVWPLVFGLVVAVVVAFFVSFVLSRKVGGLQQVLTAMAEGRAVTPGRITPFREPIMKIQSLLDERSRALAEQLRSSFDGELAAEKQRTEAFLKGIGDVVSIVDPEMRIIYLNDAGRDHFGDHMGEFCYRVYEHKSTVCGGCPVRKAMDSGEVHHSLRRMYNQKGRLLYFESTGSPIRNERNEIIAGIELARDVTQRIKLERSVEIRSRELAVANEELRRANEQLQDAFEELKNAQQQLVQSEKMASLGVLVAGIAHEINNPLNFVSASTQLLNDNLNDLLRLLHEYEQAQLPADVQQKIEQVKEETDFAHAMEDVQKIVKNIATGAGRMKQIVQNLRTFSRLDSGEKAPVNIQEGIESTLQILYHEYKNRIDIERTFDDLPAITGSPGKLNQVFMNILHNAIQAMPDKGKITITARQVGDNVRLAFSDTGPGITPENLSHVFDPFFTTKKVGEGTGLGLSISYGIVQDHGGKLWVESHTGQGTTFYVDLPIAGKAPAKAAGADHGAS